LIVLSRVKTKTEVMRILDDAMFDPGVCEQLQAEVEEHWRKLGADLHSAINLGGEPDSAR